MFRYYLTPSSARSTDTIYVVDAHDKDSAAYLVSHLGCERIPRARAIRIDRAHRHAGRGSTWAQPEGRLHQAAAANSPAAVLLKAAIEDAAAGTQETIRYCRARDTFLAEPEP